MMRTTWAWLAPLSCAGVLAACDIGLEPTELEPAFYATIVGSLEADYVGTGAFRSGSVPRRPTGLGPQLFQIESIGMGDSRNLHFYFTRKDLTLPEPGSYPLGAGLTGFSGQLSYLSRNGSTLALYAATGGEIEITLSESDRIEGNFRFEGAGACQQVGSGGFSCLSVDDAEANGSRVEVTGYFIARRTN